MERQEYVAFNDQLLYALFNNFVSKRVIKVTYSIRYIVMCNVNSKSIVFNLNTY